jgi:aldehyde:ferredoxin oxidoreductase
MRGVFGKILNIDLSSRSFNEEKIEDSVFETIHWR